ncbi:Plastid division protein [Heracleum sosnowskyi]|uniref:Plastid division protein n=1 Tax=Heracleum sosnowskyi TaxID=360622 RepID=A0AAD8IVN3_9APIA|nr:Plastid division protein [Heracleum sosnowskyi]
MVVTALGFIFFLTFKLFSVQSGSSRFTSGWALKNPKMDSVVSTTDSSLHQKRGLAFLKENSIIRKLAQILPSQKVQLRSSSEAGALKTSLLDNMNSLKAVVYQRLMHMEEAETLVKQWQTIKAEALGPNHQVNNHFELLDEAMLVQ